MNNYGYGAPSEAISIKTMPNDSGAPDPPQISITALTDSCIKINIKNHGDTIKHNLQYVQEDADEHQTTGWKNVDIECKSDDEECTMESLKPNTNYLITAASENEAGYGPKSDVLIVRTPNKPTWYKDVVGDYRVVSLEFSNKNNKTSSL